MKNLIAYIFCVLVAVAVNFKIYSFYQSFLTAESDIIKRTKASAERLAPDSASENEKKLARLVVAASDRALEIHVVKFYTFLSMALSTALIFSVPITQQLTRQGIGRRKRRPML